MNAKDHLDRAEHVLAALQDDYQKWDQAEALALAMEAVAHTTAAIAIELGAPHDTTTPGATTSG